MAKWCSLCDESHPHGYECPKRKKQWARRNNFHGNHNVRHREGDTNWRTKIKKQLMAQQPWCWQCGSRTKLELDHVVPRRGRAEMDTISNVQLLCHECHRVKTRKEKQEETT